MPLAERLFAQPVSSPLARISAEAETQASCLPALGCFWGRPSPPTVVAWERGRLGRKMADNPLVWSLEVNGFLMDIRLAPRNAQVAAYEKGLISYIPADRKQSHPQGESR